jgi:hypothetical protein
MHENRNRIQGNNNIVMQGIEGSTIVLLINGEKCEIQGLTTQKHEGETDWPAALREAITNEGVSVQNKPAAVFRHYGWLIETFLLKLKAKAEQPSLRRRLSFMTEAFQSTLRYLCYIQMAQVLQERTANPQESIAAFVAMEAKTADGFDYLELLQESTARLEAKHLFVPEIGRFVEELQEPKSDLYHAALALNGIRHELLNGTRPGEETNETLDQYLTLLVYWLRRLAFLARYRMVSVKEINLHYRMGTPKIFVHWYGELHGIYGEQLTQMTEEEDYTMRKVQDVFTYNRSVLLFRMKEGDDYFKYIADPSTYLSLSPLVIDESVLAGRPKQTPEVYYYTGHGERPRTYRFAHYKNEWLLPDGKAATHKTIEVQAQNNNGWGLNDLFEQLEQLFAPLKKQPI